MSTSGNYPAASTPTPIAPRAWLAAMLDQHEPIQLPDSAFTRLLPTFQRDAAVRLIDRLDRLGGAILADDVGLGKTYICSAVIRSCLDLYGPILVVAPAGILPYWKDLLSGLDSIDFTSFARLSLGRFAQDIPYGLVVIDEAHRLRNPATKRYRIVGQLAWRARLLLVTATPIHNSIEDAANLLRLFLPYNPLVDQHDLQGLRTVLSRVMVRRTRWTVKEVYHHCEDLAAMRIRGLPKRRHCTVRIDLSEPWRSILDDVPLLVSMAFPVSGDPSAHDLLVMLLLKRMESSPRAYLETIKRWRNYLVRAKEAQSNGRVLNRHRFRKLFGNHSDGQLSQQVFGFLFDEGPPKSHTQLNPAISYLESAIFRVSCLDSSSDYKFSALTELLSKNPRKTVVMTSYLDSARYLYEHLDHPALVLLTGSGALSRRLGRISRVQALRRFSPSSQGWSLSYSDVTFDLMVATDVLSEGVNLQEAQRLVHYDLPWNPMAMEQRVGRLDRLGCPHQKIEVVTFTLPRILENRMGLLRRLRSKLDAADSVLESMAEPPIRHEIAESSRQCEIIDPNGANRSDRFGLDRDGVLAACSSRLSPTNWSGPCCSFFESTMDGWIGAWKIGPTVRFFGIGPNGSMHQSDVLNLLVRIATTPIDDPNREDVPRQIAPPPPEWLEQVRDELFDAYRRDLFLHLEPKSTCPNHTGLREILNRIEEQRYQAYRHGRLTRVEAQTDELDLLTRIGTAARQVLLSNARDPKRATGLIDCETAEPWFPIPDRFSMETPYMEGMQTFDVSLLGWLELG